MITKLLSFTITTASAIYPDETTQLKDELSKFSPTEWESLKSGSQEVSNFCTTVLNAITEQSNILKELDGSKEQKQIDIDLENIGKSVARIRVFSRAMCLWYENQIVRILCSDNNLTANSDNTLTVSEKKELIKQKKELIKLREFLYENYSKFSNIESICKLLKEKNKEKNQKEQKRLDSYIEKIKQSAKIEKKIIYKNTSNNSLYELLQSKTESGYNLYAIKKISLIIPDRKQEVENKLLKMKDLRNRHSRQCDLAQEALKVRFSEVENLIDQCNEKQNNQWKYEKPNYFNDLKYKIEEFMNFQNDCYIFCERIEEQEKLNKILEVYNKSSTEMKYISPVEISTLKHKLNKRPADKLLELAQNKVLESKQKGEVKHLQDYLQLENKKNIIDENNEMHMVTHDENKKKLKAIDIRFITENNMVNMDTVKQFGTIESIEQSIKDADPEPEINRLPPKKEVSTLNAIATAGLIGGAGCVLYVAGKDDKKNVHKQDDHED